jgi:hypothetical protein
VRVGGRACRRSPLCVRQRRLIASRAQIVDPYTDVTVSAFRFFGKADLLFSTTTRRPKAGRPTSGPTPWWLRGRRAAASTAGRARGSVAPDLSPCPARRSAKSRGSSRRLCPRARARASLCFTPRTQAPPFRRAAIRSRCAAPRPTRAPRVRAQGLPGTSSWLAAESALHVHIAPWQAHGARSGAGIRRGAQRSTGRNARAARVSARHVAGARSRSRVSHGGIARPTFCVPRPSAILAAKGAARLSLCLAPEPLPRMTGHRGAGCHGPVALLPRILGHQSVAAPRQPAHPGAAGARCHPRPCEMSAASADCPDCPASADCPAVERWA